VGSIELIVINCQIILRFQKLKWKIKCMSDMTTNDIKNYLRPLHEEMFDGYLCVGFRSGENGRPILVGSLGNQLKFPEQNKKLRLCVKAIKDIIDEDGAENQEGVGGF
jgi:hypothetical protein